MPSAWREKKKIVGVGRIAKFFARNEKFEKLFYYFFYRVHKSLDNLDDIFFFFCTERKKLPPLFLFFFPFIIQFFVFLLHWISNWVKRTGENRIFNENCDDDNDMRERERERFAIRTLLCIYFFSLFHYMLHATLVDLYSWWWWWWYCTHTHTHSR